MKTPNGTECEYFYGDYLRGRNREECRLLEAAGQAWNDSLCRSCPVPAIRRANACQFIRLKPRVTRTLFSGFQRQVQVTAFCEKSHEVVTEPHIGCGQCHPLPPIFEIK
jgi:hypothetical protein